MRSKLIPVIINYGAITPAKILFYSILAGVLIYRAEAGESGVFFLVFGRGHAEFFLEQFGEVACGFETAHQDDISD